MSEQESVYRERSRLIAFVSSKFRSYLAPPTDAEPGFSLAVFVETPEGQLSWHISDEDLDLFAHLSRMSSSSWDGHTTAEKYERLGRLIDQPMSPLAAARKRCGFTLREVGEMTGLTKSYLSELERDVKRAPSLKVARSLANLYACTVDDLWPDAAAMSPSDATGGEVGT